ncbi:MAG: phosphate/phosphite/phosphonate ABC transporter substrate-binding protein [Alphaproteobacteria bacterium]|uniref:Phosphate/phosphite/phosphonate ABC transporter substrate-binding protein n=1 Tax=Candidatus Nitrobium versatile TaxID=2884831 RepID=A0A953J6G6_9BACT|nr:phosphate/phosphite/phosphonate ABC transporter substrate-binding protein [Candidatus Nitrobium versatile]
MKRYAVSFIIPLLLLQLFGGYACSGQKSGTETKAAPESGGQTAPPLRPDALPLVLSVLPVESAGAMFKRFLPLKYYLEKTLRVPVVIRIARDYETAIREIGTGQVHMAYLDPATYCEVRARYRNRVAPLVRAVGRADASSRSVLVAKEGSGIEKVLDVRGKRLALGTEQSSFSYLIPLAMLHDVGVRISDLSSSDYLQQEDRVALSVLIGEYDVGGMSEAVAGKYAEDGLKIIKRSEIIPPFVLCASPLVPAERREEIIKHLVSPEGRGALSSIDRDMDRFIRAGDRDFDVIRVMIRNLTGRNYIEYGPKVIKVAVLPLYSAITIYNRYDPLMRYLSEKTGYEFKLVIPRDFDDFMRIVKSRSVDFSYQNPYIFSLIDREVDIHALVTTLDEDADKGDQFRGVIITRQNSPIQDIRGLKGKRVYITSPKSAGGYLSQKLFLLQAGLDTEKDMKIIDAKRQENVILAVYKGEADAGFVRESALDVVREVVDMKKLRVLAKTSPLPNWPFALCRNTNPSLAGEVRRLLIGMSDRELLKAAGIRGFKATSDAEFELLRRY